MTEAKHTELPIRLDDGLSELEVAGYQIVDANGRNFARVARRDTANLIVTAVNERPALLAELASARRVVEAAKVLREHQTILQDREADEVENLFPEEYATYSNQIFDFECALDAALEAYANSKLVGDA